MSERLPEIASRTGLRLDDSTRHSVPSLNDLPAETVQALEDLGRLERELALRHLVTPESHSSLDSFLDAVLGRGEDPATWGLGGVLVPALGFKELLETPVERLLESLGLLDAPDRCVVVEATREAWERGQDLAGAPGRQLSPRVDYRWQAPPGTIRMMEPHPAVVPCGDPALAARRWLTSRIAFVAPRAPDVMAQARLSPDASAAVRVLERERDELGDEVGVPGYLAPAGWYASS